jgi:DNA-binding winged helix-turn-helix (wHTH) protein
MRLPSIRVANLKAHSRNHSISTAIGVVSAMIATTNPRSSIKSVTTARVMYVLRKCLKDYVPIVTIRKRGFKLMNDYTVTLVYELFLITTIVYADDEEQAKRYALQKLTQDEGLPLGEPQEYKLTLEGVFTNA